MTKTKLPYNEMKQQMLLICWDEKLTLPEIDECSAVILNFYGWGVREFLNRFCSDVNGSMPNYRIRTIEYYILSGKDNHFYGKEHTDESKKKMSAVRKGKTYDEIYGDKADDMRKSRSEKLTGRIFSEESRKKISEANKGVKKKTADALIAVRLPA